MKPKIRFKGFEGEWKTSAIGDFTTSFSGGTPTAGASEFYGGNIPFIRSGEIHESKTELFLTDAGLNNSSAKVVEKGTLLYALYGATSGEVGISKIKGAINQAILAIYPNKTVDKRFLANYLQSPKQKIVGELLQGGQGNLSGALVKSISVNYPNNREQQAISDYVDSLDSQISASTSRLASLKQMKAASLQAMFPQEGETVPKIRFKGFEGEWKKVKFSELYERSSIKNDLSFGTDKIISVANMYFIKNSRQVDDDYLRSYNIMRLGDIAFEGNKSKNFAHGRLVENTIGDGIVSHVFIVMKPISKNYDLNFWKYYINNENIMGNILVRSTKSSTMMTDLVVDDFLKESILVPSYEEQIEIGKILTSLDRQISLQSQRLEKLKQIKSACLDKMFV